MEDSNNTSAPPAEIPAAAAVEDLLDYSEFARLKLRIARIEAAEALPKSKKLVKLQIDLGPQLGRRQILAGILQHYAPESLVGRKIVVVTNLKPARLMGEESQGMLLAAASEDASVLSLLQPDKDLDPGMVVR